MGEKVKCPKTRALYGIYPHSVNWCIVTVIKLLLVTLMGSGKPTNFALHNKLRSKQILSHALFSFHGTSLLILFERFSELATL